MRLKLFTLGMIGSFLGALCILIVLLAVQLGSWSVRPVVPASNPDAFVPAGPASKMTFATVKEAYLAAPTPTGEAPQALLSPVSPAEMTPVPLTLPAPGEVVTLVETPMAEPAKAVWPTLPPPTTAPPLPAATAAAEPAEPAGFANLALPGGTATRLVIPAIGLDAPVVLAPRTTLSWQTDHLVQEVGQLEGTASPGRPGNLVLGGHYTLAQTNGGPGPFYHLKQVALGDVVIVYQREARFEYVIDSIDKVDVTSVGVTWATDTPRITLLTCSDWDGGNGEYVKRLVLQGHLVPS